MCTAPGWNRSSQAGRHEDLDIRVAGLRNRFRRSLFGRSGAARSRSTRDGQAGQVPMKIALVSERASPLAVLGGVEAGGQNVYVAELSAALARRGAKSRCTRVATTPGCPNEYI